MTVNLCSTQGRAVARFQFVRVDIDDAAVDDVGRDWTVAEVLGRKCHVAEFVVGTWAE